MANRSGNIDHPFGYGGHGYTLRMSWEETAVNATANTSTVKIVAKLIADSGYNITSTKDKKIAITCDGVTQSGTCKVGVSSGQTKTLFTATFTVPHNADGTKTAAVKCRLDIDITISGIHVSYVQGSGNITLTAIAQVPTAPTVFSITAGQGDYVGLGDTITLSWSGASGVITGYEIQQKVGTNDWLKIKDISSSDASGSSTAIITETNIVYTGAGKIVQCRIRAVNGTQVSDWKESNALTFTGGMKIKVANAWNQGSVWIKVNGQWKRAKKVWIKVNGTWTYSK